MKHPASPRLASWLLRILLPRVRCGSVIADLDEEYQTEILPARGPRQARAWYWKEAASLLKWYLSPRRRKPSADMCRSRLNQHPTLHDSSWIQPMKNLIETSAQDIRYGIRGLARKPLFTLVVITILSLGIGANSAIFSLVHGVLIQSLPYPDSDRVVSVQHIARGDLTNKFGHPEITYGFYRSENRVFEDLGIYRLGGFNLTGDESPERVPGVYATPSTFSVLGVPPALGRSFLEDDGRIDSDPTVLLSHGLWNSRFGADPDIVGNSIYVDGEPRVVVGVMPPGFSFPDPTARLWLPIQIDATNPDRSYWQNTGIARLRQGTTLDEASIAMNQVVSRLPQIYPDPEQAKSVFRDMQMGMAVTPFKAELVGDVSSTLWILLGSVGILLLIVCANVANLFIVRSEGKRQETAIRTALGAGRGVLARSYLLEGGILAIAGCFGGLVLAFLTTPVVLAAAPDSLPRLENVGINGHVVVFSAGISILTCVVFGLAPVLQTQLCPAAVMQQGAGRSTGGKRGVRIRSILATAQVTLALILMSGSGLLVRSYLNLQNVDHGFDPDGVLTLRVSLSPADYNEHPEVVAFYDDVLTRIRAIPGVTSAGAGASLPYTGRGTMLGHTMEGFPFADGEHVTNYSAQHVVPDYFEALGIPLRAGRMFEHSDMLGVSRSVILSAPLADRFWPGQNVIGKRLTPARPEDGNGWYEIVGVVGGTRNENLQDDLSEVIYYPLRPLEFSAGADPVYPISLGLAIRTTLQPRSLTRPVTDAIWDVNANVPITSVRPMRQIVDRASAQTEFSMLLLFLAASLALILGIVGLYGVCSYLVAQRTREIGIRMALGARQASVTSMILNNGLRLALIGIAIGVGASLAVTRLLHTFLFGVSPSDPTTLALVSLLLLAVSAVATLLPARRASRVDPIEVLRAE